MRLNEQIPASVRPRDLPRHFRVSRESVAVLERYVRELLAWQSSINLISGSTIGAVWHRHICDSLQLGEIGTWDGCTLVDVGSGPGLPGVPLAIGLADRLRQTVLIDSSSKKTAFLRHVVQACNLDARIIQSRIESAIDSDLELSAPVVVARAVAPLKKLLDLVAAAGIHPQRMLFLKGQDVEAELTEATKYWKLSYRMHQSRTNPAARIIEVNEAQIVTENA